MEIIRRRHNVFDATMLFSHQWQFVLHKYVLSNKINLVSPPCVWCVLRSTLIVSVCFIAVHFVAKREQTLIFLSRTFVRCCQYYQAIVFPTPSYSQLHTYVYGYRNFQISGIYLTTYNYVHAYICTLLTS